MSEASLQAESAEAPSSSSAGRGGKLTVLAIGLVGGLLGAAVGGFVVAPRVVARAAVADTADAEEHGGETTRGAATGRIVRLENLIVNPAGSEGSRFLMASVAFEVERDEDHRRLTEREVQLRDIVVGTLEAQSIAALTRPSARDSVKAQLARSAGAVLGSKAKVRVYLPQFILQ